MLENIHQGPLWELVEENQTVAIGGEEKRWLLDPHEFHKHYTLHLSEVGTRGH